MHSFTSLPGNRSYSPQFPFPTLKCDTPTRTFSEDHPTSSTQFSKHSIQEDYFDLMVEHFKPGDHKGEDLVLHISTRLPEEW